MSHFFADVPGGTLRIREHLGINSSRSRHNVNVVCPYDGNYMTYTVRSSESRGRSWYYVNGKEYNSESNKYAQRAYDKHYGIGSDHHGYVPQTGFEGEMTEVLLFTETLSSERIKDLEHVIKR